MPIIQPSLCKELVAFRCTFVVFHTGPKPPRSHNVSFWPHPEFSTRRRNLSSHVRRRCAMWEVMFHVLRPNKAVDTTMVCHAPSFGPMDQSKDFFSLTQAMIDAGNGAPVRSKQMPSTIFSFPSNSITASSGIPTATVPFGRCVKRLGSLANHTSPHQT